MVQKKLLLVKNELAENIVFCFKTPKNSKWSIQQRSSLCRMIKLYHQNQQIYYYLKDKGFGHSIYIEISRLKNPIPLFIIYRALGITSDKEICSYIILNIRDTTLLELLKASIIDTDSTYTRICNRLFNKTCILYSNQYDSSEGLQKKKEFLQDVLTNDLLPHCKVLAQDIFYRLYGFTNVENLIGYIKRN